MRTLSQERTSRFFEEPDGRRRLCAAWRKCSSDRQARQKLTAEHHLLYLILRGRDWQKAFAPITNQKKLENGGFYNTGGRRAIQALHSDRRAAALLEPFAPLLSTDALQTVRQLVPLPAWSEDPLKREPYVD